MLYSLVVGMGRAGRELHLPSLSKVRAAVPGLLAPAPVVVFDPYRLPVGVPGTMPVGSLEEASRRCPPARTVVHLCTPPDGRAAILDLLAGLDYRKIIVEKPLAVDLAGLASVARIRRRWGLDVTVVTHWLDSVLTRWLRTAVNEGEFGRLRFVRVIQNKPRFTRTAALQDHPTAFDIEVPHALAVVLSLAGDARVTGAALDDMVIGGSRLPRLGRARLRLEHRSGVRTEIDSDLTAPVRERRITLEFEHGVVVGHYPCSEADHTSQLWIVRTDGVTRRVFVDDALPAFLHGAYARYGGSVSSLHRTLPVQVDTVRLLTEAKRLCAERAARPSGART